MIHETVFIAEGARIVGDITIGEDCSIWYNAVIRAEGLPVYLGPESNIQDGSVIHVGYEHAVTIGKGVTVGHRAIIHGATIGDYTLAGMGSIILDGAKIGKHCIIGAGALVTGGTVIEDGMLVLGSPAKAIKPLTEEQIKSLYDSANHYVELGKTYKQKENNN